MGKHGRYEVLNHNLYELLEKEYASLYAVVKAKNVAPEQEAEAFTKNLITQAFKEAATENTAYRIGDFLFNAGIIAFGMAVIVAPIFFHMDQKIHTGIVSGSALSMFLGTVLFKRDFGKEGLFDAQFKGVENGYAINPHAAGNKETYARALKKIGKFTSTLAPA